MARVRVCKSCGKKMPSTCLWLCESCQALGLGDKMRDTGRDHWDVLEVAKEQEAMGIIPIFDMKMEDIVALARCYKPPYNTYGKLRGYVDSTKRLPPEEYERSKDEDV